MNILKRICGITLCISLAFGSLGCSKKNTAFVDPFTDYYSEVKAVSVECLEGMGEQYAVLAKEDATDPDFVSADYADLLINDSNNTVMEAYHAYDKLYPASITKVMTALLTLERGNLDDEIVLDHNIILTEDGAVISTLSKGNRVTVEQVLRTLLVKSANDCAVILAEYIAGSEEAFVNMMNARARELGATHTHFVTTNGLHDDNHYTTAYDLYLIFKEAIKHDVFVDIVSMKDNTMTYENVAGNQVREYMESTNHYLINDYPVPDGVIMHGGKTGTTSIAKSCLILLTENEKGERFISVVLGAETKDDLYHSMSRLLEKTTK